MTQNEATGAPTQLSCPRCTVLLTAEIVGAVGLHRCPRCGGAWLDPATFRAVCEADARRRGDSAVQAESDGPESARRQHTPERSGGNLERVRYLRCPICSDVMARVNFARVSGVILDVCRPHGAWFDAGELRAVRQFVRGTGIARFLRSRRYEAERERSRGAAGVAAGGTLDIDPIDILAGIPDRWDVPSKSATRGFVWAAVLAAIGCAFLWSTFDRYHVRGRVAAGGAALGCIALVAAYRAFAHALARRRTHDGDDEHR